MAVFPVLDDSMLQRVIIRSILKDEGHETLETRDGAKGFETEIVEKPDFMISDLIMPVMDGHTLLSALSKEGLNTGRRYHGRYSRPGSTGMFRSRGG